MAQACAMWSCIVQHWTAFTRFSVGSYWLAWALAAQLTCGTCAATATGGGTTTCMPAAAIMRLVIITGCLLCLQTTFKGAYGLLSCVDSQSNPVQNLSHSAYFSAAGDDGATASLHQYEEGSQQSGLGASLEPSYATSLPVRKDTSCGVIVE